MVRSSKTGSSRRPPDFKTTPNITAPPQTYPKNTQNSNSQKDINLSSEMYPCAPLRAPPTRTGFSVAATPELFVSLTQCNPPSEIFSILFRNPNITLHWSHGKIYWPVCSPNHPTKYVTAWKTRYFERSTGDDVPWLQPACYLSICSSVIYVPTNNSKRGYTL